MSGTVAMPIFRISLIAAAMIIGFLQPAHAAYDFRIVGGNHVYDMGSYICLDITQDTPTNVKFIIWSDIPQPVSSIVTVSFDTGRYKDLFSDISVAGQSPDGTIKKATPSGHAYLPRFMPDYSFQKEGTTLYHPGGINPGDFLMLSASLGTDKTGANVVAALNEGSNPATETTGLRVGVIVHHLKGKRRNPNVTEQDDAGFVSNAFSVRCKRR